MIVDHDQLVTRLQEILVDLEIMRSLGQTRTLLVAPGIKRLYSNKGHRY